MSRNIRSLSSRKELDDNLFTRLNKAATGIMGRPQVKSSNLWQMRQGFLWR